MKKLLLSMLALTLLCGCVPNRKHQTIFVQDAQYKYALAEHDGDLKTEFVYTDYKKVNDNGYIVFKGEKQSYISVNGKELIPYKKGVTLSNLERIIVAANSKDKHTLYNDQGEELYKEGKDVKITLYDLPVIHKGKKYIVLAPDASELYNSNVKVTGVSIHDGVIAIDLDKETIVFYKGVSDKEYLTTSINAKGDYIIQAFSEEKGIVLYDTNTKELAYFDLEGNKVLSKTIEAKSTKIKNNSLIVTTPTQTVLLTLDGKTDVVATSYYKDGETYLQKNKTNIYGPHKFVYKGEVKEIDKIQIDPDVKTVRGNIIPVYVQSKGFQYYKFDGTQAFDKTFKVAGDFDENKLACVSNDGKKFYLIDNKGNKVSKKYAAIKYISKGYYAAYETLSKFKVIDSKGNVVIDEYFIKDPFTYYYDEKDYIALNKSGTTYVYNLKDYKQEFSLNGEYVLYDDYYLVEVGQKAYYTLDGEAVYER